MNSREKIMEATRQAMQEWREAHAGAEFTDMDARMEYINSRVMELTTEETREAAETGEDATEETESEETEAETIEETAEEAKEVATMKKYFKVTFEYAEGIYCTNLAHAETAEDVEREYSEYPWRSVKEAQPWDVEEAKMKGMPIIEVEAAPAEDPEAVILAPAEDAQVWDENGETTNTTDTEEEEEEEIMNTNTKKISFEIRQLDAWGNNEEGYEINESWHMGEMTTKAQNERKAFTSWLKNHCGISFKNNRTLIEFDGDCYTIIDRKTKEPLFIAIPQY